MNDDVWKVLIDYMYTEIINLFDIEEAQRCLELAAKFQMEKFEETLSTFMAEKLDAFNCWKILSTADTINCAELRKISGRTLVENIYCVHRLTEFTELSFDVDL